MQGFRETELGLQKNFGTAINRAEIYLVILKAHDKGHFPPPA